MALSGKGHPKERESGVIAVHKSEAPDEFEIKFAQQRLELIAGGLREMEQPTFEKIVALLESVKRDSFFVGIGITHFDLLTADVMAQSNGYQALQVRENGYIVWFSRQDNVWHLNFCKEPAVK